MIIRFVPVVALMLSIVACNSGNTSTNSALSAAASPEVRTVEMGETVVSRREKMDNSSAPGAALYAQHCQHCHNGAVSKAPHLHWLKMMSPQKIFKALDSGLMKSQAAALSTQEHGQLAEYLSRRELVEGGEQMAYAPQCSADIELDPIAIPPKIGWGHDTSRFIPAAVAGLAQSDVPKLELKWAYAFPDATRARSQPAVGYGAVYVGSEDGSVYALDIDTGCSHWRFEASAEVRTGIVLAVASADRPPLAVFGDVIANMYAVNALTGELVWRMRADEHPSATLTGTPAVTENMVYAPVSSLEVVAAANPSYECCTFRGNVIAVDLATGQLHWRHYIIPEEPEVVATTRIGTKILAPSGAPTWTSPAIDRKRGVLYIGSGENYSSPSDGNSDAIIAVNLTTGERAWHYQSISGDAWNAACQLQGNPNCPVEKGPDFDHGSSMILVDLPNGKQVLTVGGKSGIVSGHDPDDGGRLLWQTRVGRGSIQGGVHFGMAAEGATIYAPINDVNHSNDGSLLDESAARPGVSAINAADGEVLWRHLQRDICDLKYCDPGISAAVTAIPGVLFAGHLDGFIRAYAKADGRVLWEYDTKQAVAAVNGLIAKGGSMSGPGATVVNGHVFVNSGYGYSLHEAGNMFAVFAVPDKK
ncbi:MAG: polyvinyl alcohol dehydrogenase (cytochrome) [Halioglobus sp.]|jgi:polyvinyl alcohol dehydrogenase (cytochrome)